MRRILPLKLSSRCGLRRRMSRCSPLPLSPTPTYMTRHSGSPRRAAGLNVISPSGWMGDASCIRNSSRAVPSNVALAMFAVGPLDDHGFARDAEAGRDRRHGRRRRRVAGQVEAGHDAGLRLGGRVDRRVFHVDRVEDAVARVVGIEDDVDEPGGEVALEGQLREQAGTPVGAVEIEIGRERPGLLVEDVERPVQVVDEEAAAARLVAQEVDAGQLAARVLAVEVTRDRQLRVVGELQRRLGNGGRGRRRRRR